MIRLFNKHTPIHLAGLCPCIKTPYSINELEGKFYLVIPRITKIERLVTKWFNQPKAHWLHLDNLGRFVLNYCDGSHSISEIEDLLEKNYGTDTEPTAQRLVKFLQILDAHHIISMNAQKTSQSS